MPDEDKPPTHNPLGLLKAMLIGITIGFIAVLVVPYLLPPARIASTYATANMRSNSEQPGVVERDTEKHSSGQGVKAPEKATPSLEAAPEEVRQLQPESVALPPQLSNPEAQVPLGDAVLPPEPVLVPAVDLKFPKTFSNEEMTAALQPLLSFSIGEGDVSAIKDVISSVSRGDDSGARAAIKRINDPAAKSFAEWRRLRALLGNFDQVLAFQAAHPLFPAAPQDALTEKALFLANAPAAQVLRFYTNRNPMTGAGKASLGAALMETGERERGLQLIKLAWNRYNLDPAVQEQFVARFGSVLDDADHRRRKLLVEVRARQADDPARKTAAADDGKGLKAAARIRAKRTAGHSVHRARHPKKAKSAPRRKGRRHGETQNGAAAREALLDQGAQPLGVTSLVEPVRLKKKEDASHKDGEKTASAKPEASDEKTEKSKGLQAKAAEHAFNLAQESTGGPATLLARLKSARRQGADDDVWSLLRSINPDKADLADPEKWWDFRRGEVRRALNDDRPATAYAIAKTHGPLDQDTRSEAEFLAGWIALRFLDEPQTAARHFEAARQIKGFARDEARAAYWLGRAKAAMGQRKEADDYYRESAARFYTFYGSLARQALRKGASCEFRAPPEPTQDAIAAFVNEDAFKAVMIAKQLDSQPLLLNYLLDLTRQLNDPQHMTLTLELIDRLFPAHVGIRAAKIALLRGFPVDAYAFPALLPKFDPTGGSGKIESALLNALTRQESDFHTGSISRVGARGLMQLMPQTAKHVASTYKLKYDPPRLISDPSYNVTLGSAFLSQLLSGYDGSYVLSLAAYNAGPGRVKQWIKDFGDPRSKTADPVDWIERIPFTETRTYIQRILESTQLYRCRFESNKQKFQIVEDLHRGRPGKVPNFDIGGDGEVEQANDE